MVLALVILILTNKLNLNSDRRRVQHNAYKITVFLFQYHLTSAHFFKVVLQSITVVNYCNSCFVKIIVINYI